MLTLGSQAFAARPPDNRLRSFLQSRERSIAGIRLRHKGNVARVYSERGFTPLWFKNGQYTTTARAIINKLENSALFGLHSSNYYTQVLSSWLNTQDSQTITQLELVLTDALFEYFHNLANGQTGERPGDANSWFAKQATTNTKDDAFNFFRGTTSFRETINQLQPWSENYTNLLIALSNQHKIQSAGGYQNIDSGTTLKPGMQGDRVAQLRRRLSQSGDLPTGLLTAAESFDSTLEHGLISFQQRHGLEADGFMGSKTLAELNVPIERRIAQIEVNLDRWRWLPKHLGDNHIIVNTAGFQMDMVLNGYPILNMNVVVGKPEHRTPIFSDEIEYLEFNPSWNVPVSIATKELLPDELASPGTLQSKNFVAVSTSDSSTRSLDSFASYELEPSNFTSRYRLRQEPGSNNALGTVKFMLPNQYSIYLHDTQAKSLFEKTTRAFSHGCVRVEDPVKLAKTLLMNDGHDEYSVEERFNNKQSKAVRLSTPLPVHITYQTSWVDQYGKLNFRDDIYDHDAHAIRHYQDQRPQLIQSERQILAQLNSFASNDL